MFRRIADFFKIPEEENESDHLSQKLMTAAFNRIEEAKQRTKEELMKNFNSILDGDAFERKTWDISVELSAPQILIPEHFFNKEALIMVLDLGKFNLTNKLEPDKAYSRQESNC